MRTKALWRAGLALCGAVLLSDAIALMTLGLFNFGIVLPGCIGASFLLLSWQWPRVAHWRAASRSRQQLWQAGWIAFALWLATVVVFFYNIHRNTEAAIPGSSPVKAVVILGSGTPNCVASPTLVARLDQGLKQAQQWPQAKVAVSGGAGFRAAVPGVGHHG